MNTKCKICMSCFYLSLFFAISSIAYSKPILIRFSHVVGEKTPKGMGAQMFQERVALRLAGKVEVQIFPSSQKFTDEQALLSLLFGDIELAAPSFPKFHKFSKALQVFDLPFLFENVEDIHKFQNSDVGQALLSSMENMGLKGLDYWDNGMRVISTRDPVTKPEDLKGLTLRIESSCVFRDQYSRLGAIGLQMPFKRLPDSLKEGVVDGYENAWSNVLSRDLHLLRPNFLEIDHSYLGYMVVTSKTFWEALPGDIRNELEAILAEVTEEVNRLAMIKAKEAREAIVKNSKVHVVTLNDADEKLWKDALMPVWKEYEEKIGPKIFAAAKELSHQK